MLEWPKAQKEEGVTDRPYKLLECYTELDRSFVDPSVLYRLNNSQQLAHRACLLRIPTGIRFTVVSMHVHSAKVQPIFSEFYFIFLKFQTYLTALAGSSQIYMPLKTHHIHASKRLKITKNFS